MSPRTEVSTREASDPPNEVRYLGSGFMAGIGHDQTPHCAEAHFRVEVTPEIF